MAKTVQPVAIELGIKGGEKLAALNRSFRDLSKQVKLSDADITQATKDIVKFATEAGNSEATIKGQIKAFEGLREQAAMGGKAYVRLGKDIANLESNLRGSTSAIDAKKKAILDLANSTGATSKQIQNAIDKLSALRTETKLDSSAFAAFGKDIEGLVAKLNLLDQQAEKAAKKAGLLAGGIRATPGSIRAQAQAFKEEAASIQLQIDGIDNLASKERTLKKNVEERLRLQERLNKLLRSEAQTGFLASVESGRKAVISAADAFNDADIGINSFNKRLQLLDDTFGKLPNTTAGFNQRLQELQKQFVNTIRDGGNYVSVALEIARVQREAAAATEGLGAALVRDLNTGVAARSSKNLREAIGQLQSEMNELDVQTAEGSRRYAENANQVRNLETQLRQLGDSYRHVSDMAQQAAAAQGVYANTATARNYLNRAMVRAQEAAGAQLAEAVRAGVAATPLMLPAAGGTTAPGTGAAMSGGAVPRRGTVGPLQPIAALPTNLGTVGGRRQRPAGVELETNDAARRSYISQTDAIRENTEAKEAARRADLNLRREIREAKGAYDGSINSINRLKSALENYRVTLPATSKRFQLLTRDLVELDRKSEAVSRRMGRRRGMSPMQMTQAAGAAISGGIFGGPEGFLGGAIGAIGGVGGAFAGAAIGAQVGGLRRQLGEFADYAAQIQKMQIALRGVAGSQDEFNRAMAAASSVTKELNIPQDVAIQGMTRLTAAVKGAGGGVADAELAFKNINSAIIATGGGAEQVEGAVTALVQIFSKGKVSAEEINQIAERLPGTFNKIAAASGRTGPELTKALQDGKVGLNDLMKFLVQLGDDYGKLAEEIAASSESAGARLQVAYDKMRQEVGKALQPIGAQFQEAFIPFIENITPALVNLLPKIGDFALSVAKNLDVLAAAAGGAALAMGALSIASIKVAGTAGLSLLGVAMMKAASAAGALTVALKASSVAALLNPWVALAAGISAATVGIYKYYEGQKELNALLDDGVGSTQVMKDKILEYEDSIRKATARLEGINGEQKATGRDAKRLKGEIRELRGELERLKGTYKIRIEYEQKGYKFGKGGVMEEFTAGGIVYGGPKGARARALRKANGEPLDGVTDLKGPTVDTADSEGKKATRDAERIAQQLAQIQLQGDAIERSKALLEVNTEIRENARQIIFAQTENNTQKAYALRQDAISLEFLKKDLEIQLDYQKAVEAAALEEKAQIRAAQLQLAEKQRIFGIEENINNALNDRIGLVQENTIELKKQAEALEDARFGLREQLGMVDPKERVARAQQEFTQQYPGATAEDLDLIRQQIDPTPFEKVQQNITQLKRELKELVDPVNQITGAATAIGDAFSQAFTDVISGAKSTEQALADAFESIGKAFLEMAAEIIAKQLAMIALQTILKALGAISSGFSFAGGSAEAGLDAANQMGGVGPLDAGMFGFRADGGPVNANQPYIVGERGPELFMPSSSGMVMSNENLQAQNRAFLDSIDTENGGTVSDDSETEREATVATRAAIRESERIQENRMQIMSQQKEFDRRYERERIEQMASTPGKLDIKYESQVINGVEYVTAEQHRKGMAQAAERGRALTLQALQNSVKTRSRVGI